MTGRRAPRRRGHLARRAATPGAAVAGWKAARAVARHLAPPTAGSRPVRRTLVVAWSEEPLPAVGPRKARTTTRRLLRSVLRAVVPAALTAGTVRAVSSKRHPRRQLPPARRLELTR